MRKYYQQPGVQKAGWEPTSTYKEGYQIVPEGSSRQQTYKAFEKQAALPLNMIHQQYRAVPTGNCEGDHRQGRGKGIGRMVAGNNWRTYG